MILKVSETEAQVVKMRKIRENLCQFADRQKTLLHFRIQKAYVLALSVISHLHTFKERKTISNTSYLRNKIIFEFKRSKLRKKKKFPLQNCTSKTIIKYVFAIKHQNTRTINLLLS